MKRGTYFQVEVLGLYNDSQISLTNGVDFAKKRAIFRISESSHGQPLGPMQGDRRHTWAHT
jgi:hypothetical protein